MHGVSGAIGVRARGSSSGGLSPMRLDLRYVYIREEWIA